MAAKILNAFASAESFSLVLRFWSFRILKLLRRGELFDGPPNPLYCSDPRDGLWLHG